MHMHRCRILIQVMGVYIAEISPKHLRGKLVTLVTIIGASSNFVRQDTSYNNKQYSNNCICHGSQMKKGHPAH